MQIAVLGVVPPPVRSLELLVHDLLQVTLTPQEVGVEPQSGAPRGFEGEGPEALLLDQVPEDPVLDGEELVRAVGGLAQAHHASVADHPAERAEVGQATAGIGRAQRVGHPAQGRLRGAERGGGGLLRADGHGGSGGRCGDLSGQGDGGSGRGDAQGGTEGNEKSGDQGLVRVHGPNSRRTRTPGPSSAPPIGPGASYTRQRAGTGDPGHVVNVSRRLPAECRGLRRPVLRRCGRRVRTAGARVGSYRPWSQVL